MSDAVRDAIAASIAALPRIVATPREPFGYGSDVSCGSDLDEDVKELDGFDPLVMKQAILRRLDTPRGSLPDDPNYGISLRSMLNAGADQERINSMGGIIRNEVCKDDRVASAVVEVTPSASFDAFRVAMAVTPVDPSLGGFSMTLAVTSAGIVLEAIS